MYWEAIWKGEDHKNAKKGGEIKSEMRQVECIIIRL